MRQAQYSPVLSYSISVRMCRRQHLRIVVMWVHQTNLCTCLDVLHVNQILFVHQTHQSTNIHKRLTWNGMFRHIMRRTTAWRVQLTLYRTINEQYYSPYPVNQPWCKSNLLLFTAPTGAHTHLCLCWGNSNTCLRDFFLLIHRSEFSNRALFTLDCWGISSIFFSPDETQQRKTKAYSFFSPDQTSFLKKKIIIATLIIKPTTASLIRRTHSKVNHLHRCVRTKLIFEGQGSSPFDMISRIMIDNNVDYAIEKETKDD